MYRRKAKQHSKKAYNFIPELPCEKLVRSIMGDHWRALPARDLDGALGVAIVWSILNGADRDIDSVSEKLGLPRQTLERPFRNLSLNGCMLKDRIALDEGLKRDERLAWCYYAGYASGYTGLVGVYREH